MREKTEVVLVRRDASTVEAISAALVDKDAGNLGRVNRRPHNIGPNKSYFAPTPPP